MRWSARCATACDGPKSCSSRRSSSSTPSWPTPGLLYDGSEERRSNYTLEGGDVHYLRPDLLVVGFSERTSPAALDRAVRRGLRAGRRDRRHRRRACPMAPTAIHLDMIFSHVDHELCVVYPPYFIGPERLAVLHRRKGTGRGARAMPSFFAARRELGLPMEPVFAGGQQPHPPGAGAVELGLQLPGGAAGHDHQLPPQRRRRCASCRPRASGSSRRSTSSPSTTGRDAKHRTVITVEGVGAGAGRRRAALHVAAAPAGGRCDRALGAPGAARWSSGSTASSGRGRRPSAMLCREVLGLSEAPVVVCDRIAIALLGSPTRASARSPDGRWGLVPEAQGSPLLDECAFAVVDVETTGMRALGSDRITEIAVVVVSGGRREVVFESLVNPGRPIPPAIRAITNITDEMVRYAPTFAEVCDRVVAASWRGASSSPTTRASTGTSSTPRCVGRGTWRWTGRRLCTVRLARRLVKGIRSCGLDSLTHWFGFANARPAPRRRRRAGHRRAARAAPGAGARRRRADAAGPGGHRDSAGRRVARGGAQRHADRAARRLRAGGDSS